MQGLREAAAHARTVHVGSGNVFADLGLPDSDDLLVKSNIVIVIAASSSRTVGAAAASVTDRGAG